jgi:hypothetical protein
MRKTDCNRTMLGREVHWEVPLPYRMVSEYRSRQGIGGEAGAAGKKKDTLHSKEDVLLCRGSRITHCLWRLVILVVV